MEKLKETLEQTARYICISIPYDKDDYPKANLLRRRSYDRIGVRRRFYAADSQSRNEVVGIRYRLAKRQGRKLELQRRLPTYVGESPRQRHVHIARRRQETDLADLWLCYKRTLAAIRKRVRRQMALG